jgi:hypothetical protein
LGSVWKLSLFLAQDFFLKYKLHTQHS